MSLTPRSGWSDSKKARCCIIRLFVSSPLAYAMIHVMEVQRTRFFMARQVRPTEVGMSVAEHVLAWMVDLWGLT